MKKTQENQPTRPVYVRLPVEVVKWADQQAKRLRRSRAFVIDEALRMYQAIQEQLERDQT